MVKQAGCIAYLPTAPLKCCGSQGDVITLNEVYQVDLISPTRQHQARTATNSVYKHVDCGRNPKSSQGGQSLGYQKASKVADSFAYNCNCGQLKWPNLPNIYPGWEFMDTLRQSKAEAHRAQGIVEKLQRILAERLFGY
ncbi:hypothetical protein CHS0354_028393 [Potamilus streckersoni]|uniref:Uncharacterized protein n=1 Tax=Potamilus streckersoni TaxID=2493646 RepID=A0AAE0VIY2_9BIVA|nr:hypothetical protein CHS0354_028393 [Potamilus streckersoni]